MCIRNFKDRLCELSGAENKAKWAAKTHLDCVFHERDRAQLFIIKDGFALPESHKQDPLGF